MNESKRYPHHLISNKSQVSVPGLKFDYIVVVGGEVKRRF